MVIGNEPNHASEWGGQINPEKYTDYLIKFSIASKSASDDFFILPAGLDSSAPNSDVTMREEDFIKNMINAHPNVFDYIDGWTSHSYPHPDFSGSANDIGKGSIKTYQWEISLLKSLGFEKDLPIFITETGWAHNGDSENNHYQSTDEISSNFIKAFNQIWTEKNIVAVTLFILNYQAEPFNKFSWKKSDKEFYDFFYKVENISKNKGEPVQINSWDILANLQTEVNSFGNIIGISLVKNTGQRIWKKNEIFEIKINEKKYKINSIFFDYVEPKETSLMFYIITPE